MTREQKLALIVGFALVLVVGVLISDQLSAARRSVDPTHGGSGTLTAALEPSSDLGPGFGRQFEQPAPVVQRPRPSSETVLVLDTGFEQLGGEPDSTTLAAQAQSAMEGLANGAEAVGDLIVQAQNEARPAMGTVGVPSLDMGETYQDPVPQLETNLEAPSADEQGQQLTSETRDEKPSAEDVRPVRTHRVQEDETLWSIAKKYYGDGSLANALAAHNASRIGKGNVIQVGASLLIPDAEVLGGTSKPTATKVASAEKSGEGVKKDTKKSDAVKKPESTKKPTTTVPKTYTVKSGDTLQKISDKFFGTTKRWNDILELNDGVIDDEDGLQVGMVIKLPKK